MSIGEIFVAETFDLTHTFIVAGNAFSSLECGIVITELVPSKS